MTLKLPLHNNQTSEWKHTRYNAPVTTALRPVFPPANTMIMDSTNVAWVVTPRRFPMTDIIGMATTIRRNFTRLYAASTTHRLGRGGYCVWYTVRVYAVC